MGRKIEKNLKREIEGERERNRESERNALTKQYFWQQL